MKHLSLLFLLVFTNSFLFSQNLQIALTGTSSVSCFGQNDGAVQVAVTGGTLPYSFSWNLPGLSGDSLSNLTAGTYIVTVTDAFSSSVTDTFTISNPAAIQLDFTSTLAYPEFGSATVMASGGVPPYSCEWQHGDTTFTATDLYPGVYVCTVTDASGCTQEGNAFLMTLPPILVAIDNSNTNLISCFGSNDGALAITFNGGAPPYTVLWSNSDTGIVIQNLPAGNYTCTVTDALGGTGTVTLLLNDPPLVSANISFTNATDGQANGTAVISFAAGGQGGPYSYIWSTGETTALISNLSPGIYTCTVTGLAGCSYVESVTIQNTVDVLTLQEHEQISISPNPAQNRCTIEWNGACPVKIIQLYNSSGVLVFQDLIRQMNTYSFSTTNYPPGIYQIGLVSESGNIILKPLVIGE